jgi:hypothetical protein
VLQGPDGITRFLRQHGRECGQRARRCQRTRWP